MAEMTTKITDLEISRNITGKEIPQSKGTEVNRIRIYISDWPNGARTNS